MLAHAVAQRSDIDCRSSVGLASIAAIPRSVHPSWHYTLLFEVLKVNPHVFYSSANAFVIGL